MPHQIIAVHKLLTYMPPFTFYFTVESWREQNRMRKQIPNGHLNSQNYASP